MSKVFCSNCGAEVILPEHSSFSMGMCIAKDTNGNYVIETESRGNKMENRMDTLKANGIDTSKFFSMKNLNGDDVLMTWDENGLPKVADESDKIAVQISSDGYIENKKLWRRFVMAQMFHALEYKNGYAEGYTGWLHSHGYKYQWKEMINEFNVLAKLEKEDPEEFASRSRFFNRDVARAVCLDYVDKLEKYLSTFKHKNCKGIPYITVPKFGDVFVCDVNKKVLNKYRSLIWKFNGSYRNIYYALIRFNREMIHLPNTTKMSDEFVNAYKGAGAYYTCKNLIIYHNCLVDGTSCITDSLSILEHKTNEYVGEYWRLLGFMKKLIKDNNFCFEDRMHELNVRGY